MSPYKVKWVCTGGSLKQPCENAGSGLSMSPIAFSAGGSFEAGNGLLPAGEPPQSETSVFFPQEQRWTPVYCSLAAACLKSPLIEKPGGEVRLLSHLVECHNWSKMACLSFRPE